MEKWLCQQGAASQMTIILQLFDYLTDALPMDHHREQGIAIAGNLEESKSGYIYTLGRMLANSFPLHLYGKGYISNERIKQYGMALTHRSNCQQKFMVHLD